MNEMWRDIKGYEGLYQVSNLGRVKSLYDGGESIRRIGRKPEGYLDVDLYKCGMGKTHYVHRLVAEAFIPNPYELPQVNHIDEDKTNNCVWNLEWCDRKYNMNYGTGKIRSAEKRSKRVYQYTKSGVFVRSYKSVNEASRQTGIAFAHISDVAINKPHCKTAGGYVWSYIPPIPPTARVLF